MIKAFISAVAIMFATVSAFAAPVNGELAPAFTGLTMNGKTISLADFKGKPVVLEWTNHECPYVGKHYPYHVVHTPIISFSILRAQSGVCIMLKQHRICLLSMKKVFLFIRVRSMTFHLLLHAALQKQRTLF